MVYAQLKSRVILAPGEPLLVHHVADIKAPSADETKKLMNLPLSCPSSPGIWQIPSIHVMETLSLHTQEITPLGPPECYVHLIPRKKQNKTNVLRSVIAFLLLFFGSLLAICWFHADVNMNEAQQTMFYIMTGKENAHPLMLSIPYAIGVFFGVALFYALIGRKGTISPLEIKMNEYHTTSEKAAGRIP